MREAEYVAIVNPTKRGGDANMQIESIYILFIYILLFCLIIVTVIAVALFVALVVTIRKLDKQKNTSLSGR